MTKISMVQVYRTLWECPQVRIARTERREYAKMPFEAFRLTMLRDELIVTESTARSKWEIAIGDGIVYPSNDAKRFGMAILDLEALAVRIGEPYTPEKCVCRVCVSEGINTTSEASQ